MQLNLIDTPFLSYNYTKTIPVQMLYFAIQLQNIPFVHKMVSIETDFFAPLFFGQNKGFHQYC